ncbi:ComF family protein [Selenomonas sp. FC4001]|uniref:ComF family protein n=1 Tax=Selenomonas sp. FC4001 TaxID=1408313 RepID=UPI001E347111|nr:ComF family protein [Selenomonas sp. FC4001]
MVNLWETLLDFLFPPHCPLCHAYVEKKGGWCPACLTQALQPHRLPLSVPMRAFLADAWALGLYKDSLRDLIRHLKYQKQRSNLPYLESLLAAAGDEADIKELLAAVDIAVPVPLYPAKEKQRGFNQAELIFGSFLTCQNIPLLRLLERRRATKPMYELSEQERAENLKNAFAVTEAKALQGKTVLLVDDILTTGATMAECARVLREAGAKSVRGLVLASDHG